jgi:SAM-dependent methyltransferase
MPNPAGKQDNADQIAYWNDRAAVTWTAAQERLDALFAPLTATALAEAAPATGERVIDIGCGCGATVLALADRVGPTGHVLALDVSEPMAARARERVAAAGLTNAEVIVSDAATHTFPRPEADLLFSRFGVMFLADPVAAFANLRRAMQPNGRLVCVAWRPLADNPWFYVPLEAARTVLPPLPPADPDVPGPFAFANRERTMGIISGAGWHNAKLTQHDVAMTLAATGEIERATEFATEVGVLARVLADVDPDTRARARQAVADALRAHDGSDGIRLRGSVWLISARA